MQSYMITSGADNHYLLAVAKGNRQAYSMMFEHLLKEERQICVLKYSYISYSHEGEAYHKYIIVGNSNPFFEELEREKNANDSYDRHFFYVDSLDSKEVRDWIDDDTNGKEIWVYINHDNETCKCRWKQIYKISNRYAYPTSATEQNSAEWKETKQGEFLSATVIKTEVPENRHWSSIDIESSPILKTLSLEQLPVEKTQLEDSFNLIRKMELNPAQGLIIKIKKPNKIASICVKWTEHGYYCELIYPSDSYYWSPPCMLAVKDLTYYEIERIITGLCTGSAKESIDSSMASRFIDVTLDVFKKVDKQQWSFVGFNK